MSIIESIRADVEAGKIESEVVIVKGGGYTAYQLWKMTVATFKAVGIVRPQGEITSQYVYNMAKQGVANGQTYKDGLKGVRFSEKEAESFVRKMVARNLQYLVTTPAELVEDEEQVVETVATDLAENQFDNVDDESDDEDLDDETEETGRHGA